MLCEIIFFLALGRKTYRAVATLEIKHRSIEIARLRSNSWGMEVLGRLQGISDLVAEEANYHINCKTKFESMKHLTSIKAAKVSQIIYVLGCFKIAPLSNFKTPTNFSDGVLDANYESDVTF